MMAGRAWPRGCDGVLKVASKVGAAMGEWREDRGGDEGQNGRCTEGESGGVGGVGGPMY